MKPGDLCTMSDQFTPVISGVSLWSGPRLAENANSFGLFAPSDVAIVTHVKSMSDGDRDHHNHWTSLKIVTSRGWVGWVDRRFLTKLEEE